MALPADCAAGALVVAALRGRRLEPVARQRVRTRRLNLPPSASACYVAARDDLEMRVLLLALGLLAWTLVAGQPASAGGPGCCACTFCNVPSFCSDGVPGQADCDTFCNAGGDCTFHTVVPETPCSEVGVCAQAAPPSVRAPAMSPALQVLLVGGLGAFGYAILKRRSAKRR